MSDSLHEMLLSIDDEDRPTFVYDHVESWPDGDLQRCLQLELFIPLPQQKYPFCYGCGEQAANEVVQIKDRATGDVRSYLPCAVCGPMLVPNESLQWWQVDHWRFRDVLLRSAEIRGYCEEIVEDRVWRLGRASWAETSWSVYFARALHRRDTWEVINRAKFPARSVVFVPVRTPADDARTLYQPCIIPLLHCTAWKGNNIRWDQPYVDSLLAEHLERAKPILRRPVRPKRAERAEKIERLTDFMIEHVRAARDHAVCTRDREGTPRLLEKPKQRDLARMLEVKEATIGRCLRDPAARELRLLWSLADDVDQLLSYRPRMKR